MGGLGERAGESALLGGEELPTAFSSALLAAPRQGLGSYHPDSLWD